VYLRVILTRNVEVFTKKLRDNSERDITKIDIAKIQSLIFCVAGFVFYQEHRL
jgi:hypothetical protein